MTNRRITVLTGLIFSLVSAAGVSHAWGARVRSTGERPPAEAKQPGRQSIPQDLKISASVDRTAVDVGGQVTLTLTIEGDVTNAELKPFELPTTLVVVAQSRSTNLSMQAGSVTRSMSLVYVLAAQQPGTCQLGPFQLTRQGTQVQTEPLEIVIRKPVLPPSLEPHERLTL